MSIDYEPVVRSVAYKECRLCHAEMPMPTAAHLRRHYLAFHLVSKEPAIDELIQTAEREAGIEADAERIIKTRFFQALNDRKET